MFVQQLNLVSILLPFQSPIPLYLSVVSSGIGSASPHRPSSSPRSDPSSSASPAPPCRRWCRSRPGCRLSPKPRCSSSVQPGPTKGTVRPDVLTSQQLPQLPGHGCPDEVLRLPAHSQHLPAARDRLPDAAQVVDVARCCQPPHRVPAARTCEDPSHQELPRHGSGLFLTRQLHREYLHRSHSAPSETAMKKPVEVKNSRVEQQGR